MTLVVIPSKLNVVRHAKPLHAIARNPNVKRLVVDTALRNEFLAACEAGEIAWAGGPVEWKNDGQLAIIGLDESWEFVASYRSHYWPHFHPCPVCHCPTRCECAFPDNDFRDSLAKCSKCRGK